MAMQREFFLRLQTLFAYVADPVQRVQKLGRAQDRYDALENPVIQGTVILEFECADGVRDVL